MSVCPWDSRQSKDQLWQLEAQTQTGTQPGVGQPDASTETTLTLTKPKITQKIVSQISVLPTLLQSPKFNVHMETEREHSNLTNEGKGLSPNPLGAVAKPHHELIDEIQSQGTGTVCIELL